MNDMDSDYIDPPGVFRRIVGFDRKASGTALVLECKHKVPALDHLEYRFGDPHVCARCSAKALADLLARMLARK